MKVVVDVLGSPFLIVVMVSVEVKLTSEQEEEDRIALP